MNIDIGALLAMLVPIVAIQLGLAIFALYDLTRSERRVKGGSKVVWALVIILIGFVGPILYLLAGREDA